MASTVPAALPAFISIMTAALPPTMEVWFGKPMPAYPSPQMLQVVAIRPGENELITLGPDYRQDERFEFECILTCWAGDLAFTTRLSEVFGLYQLVTVAIGNNPTLNQTVRFAYVRTWEYTPGADESGRSLGELTFSVACEARISTLS